MIPWRELDRAAIPGQADPLVLSQRGDEFVIRIGPHILMTSRSYGSEETMAALACSRVAGRPGCALLIGGLGMGFTLAASLRHLPAGARVVVAELIPAVVAWNRGPLAHLAGHPLDDSRVTAREAAVEDLIRGARDAYDAILLDVDNGPGALTRPSNDRIYSAAGLREAHRALRASGVLGVWSAAPDARFTRRLSEAGFSHEVHAVRSRGMKGGRHTIWLGVRSGRRAG